jgi:hypothetical protein
MAKQIEMCPADQINLEGCNFTGAVKLAVEGNEATVLCCWFARCENEATRLRPHPVLGDTPICARCDDRMEAMG